ncbi:MAG TPA: glycosyltransferase family 2 protein [Bryobacteraceae bacterium]|nr:glycosyltransferase family 2 protein [Bryobacteraceae bacterium]
MPTPRVGHDMRLSVVIPVFNEALTLKQLLARLNQALEGIDWEAIFVNDGSTDGTLAILRVAARRDRRVKVLSFPRNFGHQAAITAGLDFAQGDAVAVMDADLQDPPELLPRMLDLLSAGYDVVSPQRVLRPGETRFKRCTAALFYRLLAWMMDGRLSCSVGDFRLFSRRAVLAVRSFREQHRFMRGLVSWLGLKEATLPFERPARSEGVTKYSPLKMARLAWTAVTSFSALPLRLAVGAGAALSGIGVAGLWHVFYRSAQPHLAATGWAASMALQCIFSGLILLALGIVGDYVARSYQESKGRPLYVITDLLNLSAPECEIKRTSILLDTHSGRRGLGEVRMPENAPRVARAIQRV